MPVAVNAVEWDGSKERYEWLRGWTENRVRIDTDNNLLLQTNAGVRVVTVGDHVVKGIYGGLYPVKPKLFERTHKEVADVATA